MSERNCDCGSNFASGFIIGAIIGAAIGFLYAPKPGKETREFLKHKAEELKEKTSEVTEKTKETAADARKRMEAKIGRKTSK